MSLKRLIVRRRKPRPSPANVIIGVLKRFGVKAPVTTAAAITADLRANGYTVGAATRCRGLAGETTFGEEA
jgi:hypothetical protein